MKYLLLFLLFALPHLCLSQEAKSLEDCNAYLDQILDGGTKTDIKESSLEDIKNDHTNLFYHIYYVEFEEDGALEKNLRKQGLANVFEFSQIVFRQYHSYLNELPFDPNETIAEIIAETELMTKGFIHPPPLVTYNATLNFETALIDPMDIPEDLGYNILHDVIPYKGGAILKWKAVHSGSIFRYSFFDPNDHSLIDIWCPNFDQIFDISPHGDTVFIVGSHTDIMLDMEIPVTQMLADETYSDLTTRPRDIGLDVFENAQFFWNNDQLYLISGSYIYFLSDEKWIPFTNERDQYHLRNEFIEIKKSHIEEGHNASYLREDKNLLKITDTIPKFVSKLPKHDLNIKHVKITDDTIYYTLGIEDRFPFYSVSGRNLTSYKIEGATGAFDFPHLIDLICEDCEDLVISSKVGVYKINESNVELMALFGNRNNQFRPSIISEFSSGHYIVGGQTGGVLYLHDSNSNWLDLDELERTYLHYITE